MRLLVIGRGTGNGTPTGHQLDGFRVYRRALRRAGIHVTRHDAYTLPTIEATIDQHSADVVMVMVSFKETPQDVTAMWRRLSERPGRPRLIMLDCFAQTSSPYFSALPYVDRYVKRQLLRDRDLYQREFAGGFIFTDFYARHFDYDLDGWHFGSRPDVGELHKLVVGWNLGVTGQYRRLLRRTRRWGPAWDRRTIDINGRIGAVSHSGCVEWYQDYRRRSREAIELLDGSYRVSSNERLSRRPYLRELRQSRLVFSPFGWGELCFRDYEAVCCGALLIKPSMEHLETHPDIFDAEQTYVPVRWDLSDLGQRCRHYLEHPDQAQRIIANAQQKLSDYFERDGFVNDVQRVLQGL